MKIQEFAQQTGLPAKTIRFYESIGLLPAPQRAPNGYREYNLFDSNWRAHSCLEMTRCHTDEFQFPSGTLANV